MFGKSVPSGEYMTDLSLSRPETVVDQVEVRQKLTFRTSVASWRHGAVSQKIN